MVDGRILKYFKNIEQSWKINNNGFENNSNFLSNQDNNFLAISL